MARKAKTDPPDELSPEEKDQIREWCSKAYPFMLKHLSKLWFECRDWHLANGVQRVSWVAAFRRWVRKQVEIDSRPKGPGPRRPGPGSSELPQMSLADRRSKQEMQRLGEILKSRGVVK